MKSRFYLTGMLAFIIILSSGCGRVREVYMLPQKALGWQGWHGLDHVATTTATMQLRGASIQVDLLDPRKSLARDSPGLAKNWDWKQWHEMVEAATADALHQTRIFKDVGAKNDPGPMIDSDFELIFALTEWNPGNRWLRYFFGFGLGRTRMQIEGKIRSVKTRQIVFAFADAREHPGGPSSFPIGFKALKTQELMKEDLGYALVDLQQALRDATGTKAELLPRPRTHPKYHPKLSPDSPIPKKN
jgi:hypothetical protein